MLPTLSGAIAYHTLWAPPAGCVAIVVRIDGKATFAVAAGRGATVAVKLIRRQPRRWKTRPK
jgi:hypothetical protein